MSQQRRPNITEKEADKLLPLLAEFNGMAKELIRMLNHKVAVKEKKISSYLTGMSLPKNMHSNISVHAIDIRNTKGVKRGSGSYTPKMGWEKDIMRGPSGIVI